MTSVITTTGFEVDVDENCVDDMELLDLISETMDGSPLAYSKIADKLIGEEKRKELYDHIRDKETKRVKIADFVSEVTDIMKQLNSKKK